MMAQGMKMMKDKNGYRRIVPSPMPVKIIEENIIREIIQNAAVVIAAGGGGIPVINRNGMIEGIEAVIDKDLTGSLLASVIGAEILLILTDVEKAALNYGKDDETGLDEITVSEAERYVKEGHFGKGSMEPKVLAAVKFVRSGGKAAIISSLEKALPALHGETGTRIIA
jgi:carbamate kinase